MASNAVTAHGTLLQMQDGGTGWITIAEQTVVDLSLTTDEVNISIHNEPLGFSNYLPGSTSGEIALTANFLANDFTHSAESGILFFFINKRKWYYRVVWPQMNPERSMVVFAFPRQFNVPAPAGTAAAIQFSTILRMDGAPIWF